jgi:hypothetical protein
MFLVLLIVVLKKLDMVFSIRTTWLYSVFGHVVGLLKFYTVVLEKFTCEQMCHMFWMEKIPHAAGC